MNHSRETIPFVLSLVLTLLVYNESFLVQSFTTSNIPRKNIFSSSTRATITQTQTTTRLSNSNDDNEEPQGIDPSSHPKIYSVTLPRAPGIEWGTDLSFSFVYVRALEMGGAASLSGLVSPNDQICQLRPVSEDGTLGPPQNLVGASFDTVMNAFATLDKTVQNVELIFFNGSKEELKAAATGDAASAKEESDEIIITVIENKGSENQVTKTLKAKKGCNVREELVDRGINVYQSITRWTNCKGKQLCGTCIVNIPEGGTNTNRKSMDEESTLRENPEEYRLSCVTFAYGDVTVETFPPVNPSQWTR